MADFDDLDSPYRGSILTLKSFYILKLLDSVEPLYIELLCFSLSGSVMFCVTQEDGDLSATPEVATKVAHRVSSMRYDGSDRAVCSTYVRFHL